MKSKQLANLVWLTHMSWLAVLVVWPIAFAEISQKHMMDAAFVQVFTSFYWKFNCPLTSLEKSLKDGEEINKGWIIQPVVTLFAIPLIFELIT